MGKQETRDDFPEATKRLLQRRADNRCSKPDCRQPTIWPSEANEERVANLGVAAHITAAQEGGPRYDPALTTEQRRSAANGIWLCHNHSRVIDDNNGADFPAELLHQWKREHEEWVRQGCPTGPAFDVSGEFAAKGKGRVTALEVTDSAIIRPGTRAAAEGEGEITGARFGRDRKER